MCAAPAIVAAVVHAAEVFALGLICLGSTLGCTEDKWTAWTGEVTTPPIGLLALLGASVRRGGEGKAVVATSRKVPQTPPNTTYTTNSSSQMQSESSGIVALLFRA